MENGAIAIVVSNIALIGIMVGTVVSIWIHQSNKFDKIDEKFNKIHEEIMNLNIKILKKELK